MANQTSSKRTPFLWIPSLYFAQGLPFFAVNTLVLYMYKSLGYDNSTIAFWTGMVGFVWVFKPLWSPFLELVQSKKFVIILFQIIGGISLGLLASSLHLPSFFAVSIAMLFVAAVAAATHDIAADGLYIETLDSVEQAKFVGWMGAAFNIARVFSTGALVSLAGYLEKTHTPATAWSYVYGLAGLMLIAIALYHTWSLPDVRTERSSKTANEIYQTLSEVVIEFFKKPGIWLSILFILLFRAAEGQIQTIGPLFLKEARASGGLGLDNAVIGSLYGVIGSLSFIAGSLLGGYFTAKLSLKKALPWLVVVMNLPNIVFCFLSMTQTENYFFIATCLGLEMFGYGFGFVGLILYMMQVVAVGKFKTAHYALATGVMQLGLVIPKMISGEIQTRLGYQNFFIWVLISAIPVLLMTRFLNIPEKEASATDN